MRLAGALADGWGLDVAAADYAALGAGSYHWFVRDAEGARAFVTVDDLDQKTWLGDTRDCCVRRPPQRVRHRRRASRSGPRLRRRADPHA